MVPDVASCLAYLEQLRWPDGFVCPAGAAAGGWRTAKARWMCTSCGRQTSVTAGTIFHRTRTPLSTCFAAIWLLTSQKNGMSALGLQRVLGFGSYETAWAWLQKLRRAM
ncbi:MAG: transposase, partial [Actinomycetota bacterium]|nr:transposase [Actinomycetota bacterium]